MAERGRAQQEKMAKLESEPEGTLSIRTTC